jgi:tetratricopeptide (TPR) repeat protein
VIASSSKRLVRQATFFVMALALLLASGCGRNKDATSSSAAEESVADRATKLMQNALEQRKLHRWGEAIADYQKAIELAPDDPDVHRGAKVFERLSKFLPGIRELDARLAMTPEDDQLLTDRALSFLRGQDAELALVDAEAAAQKAPWAMRPRLFRAAALIELGRSAECEALGVNPRLRFSALASEFLETISRLDAEISLERDNAELYVSRAWQLNEIGQPKLALEDAETALRNDSSLATAQMEASYALTKLERRDEALQQIKRATELDPQLPNAWQYRGELEMAAEDYVAAIESFTRVLANNQTAMALQKREQCYIKLGQYEKAEADHRALEKLK